MATAEDTQLPGASYDLVTAGQCWHWFDGDRAAAEARRLLRPGGSVVIAHFDWIPLPGNVASSTEAKIERHIQQLSRRHPREAPIASAAGR